MVGENQARNLYVVGTSTNTTIATVAAGANLNAAVLESDGTAAVADKPFLLAVKNGQGELISSDEIDPNKILYAHSVDYVARSVGKASIGGFTVTAGELYQIQIIFQGHGSLSVENEYIKEAFYKAVTGDDAEKVVDGLIKSLARNFSREEPNLLGETFAYVDAGEVTHNLPENAFFSFSKGFTTQTIDVDTAPTADANATVTLDGVDVTVALLDADTDEGAATKIAAAIDAVTGYSASATGTVVTVTTTAPANIVYDAGTTGTTVTQDGTAAGAGIVILEKASWLAQYYVTGKKTRLDFPFEVRAYNNSANPTVVQTKGFEGTATGYHVRNMEYYYKGNRADTFRGAGYPHNFEENYDSVLSQAYYLVEIGYWDESRDEPMKSKKQLTIAAPSAAVADVLIGQINTALTNVPFSIATLS